MKRECYFHVILRAILLYAIMMAPGFYLDNIALKLVGAIAGSVLMVKFPNRFSKC